VGALVGVKDPVGDPILIGVILSVDIKDPVGDPILAGVKGLVGLDTLVKIISPNSLGGNKMSESVIFEEGVI
jgi:hypothetical protein